MFTGIIEDIGTVQQAAVSRLEIRSALTGVQIGDSIAVNGTCLTTAALGEGSLFFDLMPRTAQDTGLAGLRSGDRVNLERALPVNGRLGGHIVSGHVDESAVVDSVTADTDGYILRVKVSPKNKIFLAPKGSIAVNGVSLTIQSAQEDWFTVSLVGHTLDSTTLAELSAGQYVNIEYDLLIRYLRNLLPAAEQPSLRRYLF